MAKTRLRLILSLSLFGVLSRNASAQFATPPPSIPPPPFADSNVHISSAVAGFHQHYFSGATSPMIVNNSDYIYAWVYLDPLFQPTEVMLQVYTTTWVRVYWGTEMTGATARSMGALPATGGWVKLTAPASSFGINFSTNVTGMAFTLWDGMASWGPAGMGRIFTDKAWVTNGTPPGAVLQSNSENWQWVPSYRRNWLQFGGDPGHSGNNPTETMIGLRNASNLLPLTGFTHVTMNAPSPVLLANVVISGTAHDVLYVNNGGTHGVTAAFDAYTGGSLWTWSNDSGPNNFASVPAIDPLFQEPDHKALYTVGSDACLHKLALDTGHEFSGTGVGVLDAAPNGCITAGWPAQLTTNTFDKIKSAVTIGMHNGAPTAYVAGTEDGDGSAMVGSITAINLNDGSQHVFNSMCSNLSGHLASNGCAASGGDFWARGGLTYDIVNQRILGATGNITTIPDPGWSPSAHRWSVSLLALNFDGTGSGNGNPVDSFTPQSWNTLDGPDLDLGSTNTLILPRPNSSSLHLAAQGGKDGNIRLVNLNNMSGSGGPGFNTDPVATLPLSGSVSPCSANNGEYCTITGPMATWSNPIDNSTWIYANAANGLNMIQIATGTATFMSSFFWMATTGADNGTKWGAFVANGVLYFADTETQGCPAGSTGTLWAVDAATASALWSTCHSADPLSHATPVVINGVLYFNGAAWSVGGASPLGSLPSVNLAQGAQTTQSSNPIGAVSALGNDDNTDGDYWDGSVFHTNPDSAGFAGFPGGPWWVVGFAGPRQVKQVVLYNRTDCCQPRLGGFKILYNNGSSWNVAADYSSYVTSTVNPIITVPVNITNASQVAILKTAGGGDNYLHLADVQVIGD